MTPYYDDGTITIYLGDCRDIPAWHQLGDVMVTDPPYGMAFSSNMGGASFGTGEIIGDEDTTARDDAIDLWGDRPALVFGRWSIRRPERTRMVLTWEKGNHVGMGDLSLPWKPNTEEIYVLGSGFEGHRGSSVLRYNAPPNVTKRHHPTQKPVDLMRDLIAKCPPGIVVDPFMGSGSTLRAARDLGRRAIGCERHEPYAAVAVQRLAQRSLFEEDM